MILDDKKHALFFVSSLRNESCINHCYQSVKRWEKPLRHINF